MHSPGLSHANDSRISLLSMAGTREDVVEPPPAESSRLSLEPAVKNIKSTRALSNQHSANSPKPGRPRSRTQSSEQGIVTVFSGNQEPPPLDPDLDALNKLPKYRPLVLAPSSNRLSGIFHLGARYIEPTAEQLNLDETELVGLCFSFRDYLSNRVQRVCDRQSEFVTAAKHIGARATETQTRLVHVNQLAKHEQDSLSVLKTLQRQTEKSYELIQDVLHDLERLDAALPTSDRLGANESNMATEFPYLTKMLAQRRRSALPASQPHSNAGLRRQIVAKKAGIPAFPSRTSSVIPPHSRSSLAAYQAELAGANIKARPSPYHLPGLSRQSSALTSSRSHSKWLSDSRSLRPRGSRSSINSSDHSNSSLPASPNTTDEARVSFDGEAIHPTEMTSIALLASQGTPRSLQRRSVQPFSSLRPPASSKSVYGDYKSSYSRSEVSLSKEQVVWSPQISTCANESSFGYFKYGDSTPQVSLADVEEEYSRCARLVGADANDNATGSHKSGELSPGPLSVPSDINKPENQLRNRRPSRISISALHRDDAVNVVSIDKELSPASDISYSSITRTSGEYSNRPVISPGSARIPHLRMPLGRSAGSPVSPKSLPHALSLRSASSLGSSPSAQSITQLTPIGSPSAHAITNQLNVVATPDACQLNRQPVSPQFPLEATRMLRQVIMEQPDGNTEARTASRCSTPQDTVSDHRLIAHGPGSSYTDSYGGGLEQGNDVSDNYQRSRTSSIAASQLSATEGSDGTDVAQTTGTLNSTSGSRTRSDSIRGLHPWARTNPERMSTWSSSSARTLADGMYGSRISSVDDSSRGSKRPPSSAALNSLAVSAAMINRQSRSSISSDRKSSTIHTGSRVTSARPAIDLGLTIRSDLEHRVRSYSESGQNPLLHQDGRPHSSMGFHETVAGAPIWSARPDSIHARRHSPHSASLRHFRADKFNPHRLSMMSVGSQSSRQGPMSSDSAHSDGQQSDAASISTSYSSQAADRLLPLVSSQSTATSTAIGKRRAQTMDQN
ncbi:hypothetical protein GGH96_004867 [Coemansia sp. RSA 1972]|nr:hypothetical protein GGH96_004867 [Coemansia sp. RSA 1972]